MVTEQPARRGPIEITTDTEPPGPFRPDERPLFIGGRVEERTAIHRWFARTVEGVHTTALLLNGPRGTGKTTLSGYLVEQAGQDGWLAFVLGGDLGTSFADQLAALRTEPARKVHWKVGFDVGVVQATMERALKSAPDDLALSDVILRVLEHTENGVLVIVDEAQAARWCARVRHPDDARVRGRSVTHADATVMHRNAHRVGLCEVQPPQVHDAPAARVEAEIPSKTSIVPPVPARIAAHLAGPRLLGHGRCTALDVRNPTRRCDPRRRRVVR